ncbi:demethoxyubiquinone hydroxylase family protein, partial [Xanthomonas perforans]
MTQIPPTRLHSPLDRLLVEAQRALDPVFGHPPAERPNPAAGPPAVVLDPAQRRHAAGLMRLNHVGEV